MDDELIARPVPMEPPPRRGRWLVMLAGVAVFGLFAAVIWYAYVEGLAGLGGEPPLIRAEAGPYRHVPEERGGLPVPNQTAAVIDVFRPEPAEPAPEILPPPPEPTVDPTAEEPRLAAPPDAPDPATLPPLPAEPPPAPAAPPEAAPALPEQLAAPAEAAPAPPPAELAPPAVATAPPSEPVEVPAPVLWIPVPKPAALAAPTRPAPPAALQAPDPPPARIAAVEPPRRAEPTQPRPTPPATRAEPPPPPPRAAAPPARTAVARPPAPPAAPPAPRAPAPPPESQAASAYRLQLLALRSEGAMDQAWAQLRMRYPRVLSELSPSVERIATVSGTMYRLQAGPFETREAATSACAAIQAQGGQCFVVSSAQ